MKLVLCGDVVGVCHLKESDHHTVRPTVFGGTLQPREGETPTDVNQSSPRRGCCGPRFLLCVGGGPITDGLRLSGR